MESNPFLDISFVKKELIPWIHFEDVNSINRVCKAWMNAVSMYDYVDTVIETPPTEEEVKDYLNNGGDMAFRLNAEVIMKRGRFWKVERFMSESRFEKEIFESVYGLHEFFHFKEFNRLQKDEYNRMDIINTTKNIILQFIGLKNEKSRGECLVELISFFLVTYNGKKFCDNHPVFRKDYAMGRYEHLLSFGWKFLPKVEETYLLFKSY